jgi:hypothetical protein
MKLYASLVLALMLAGCSKASTTNEQSSVSNPFASQRERMIGDWGASDVEVHIKPNGYATLQINRDGIVYAGPLVTDGDSEKMVSATIMGTFTYKFKLIGSQLQLTNYDGSDHLLSRGGFEQAETQRIADEKAAALVQQQTEAVEQARQNEAQRLQNVSNNVSSCWNGVAACTLVEADLRANPSEVRNAVQKFIADNNISSEAVAEREGRLGPMPGLH